MTVDHRAELMGWRLSRWLGLVLLAVSVIVAGAHGSPARATPTGFADLADKLSPAVVNISTAQNISGGPGTDGSPLEDLFRDLYPRGGPERPRQIQSLGSGFVVTPDGFVVTNNHVIEDADEITVNFPNGLSLVAKLVGTDQQTDLAVLKVEHDSPLPFVSFGDSNTARVGDWVLAIGNPFGFSGSVSAGIISAFNRNINAGRYDDFIQTDAAINRGNSGGPLFNMSGEVIGVNTAIYSPTGNSIGIGFSVPANLAKRVVDQLQEFGAVKRGWLGVRIQTVNEELAEALGMEKPMGALVAEVTPGGPAEEAGLEAGDVVVKFDGKDVVEMRDLPRLVADTDVGKAVRVVVFRKGQTQTLKVTVGLLDEGRVNASAPASEDKGSGAMPEGTVLDTVGITLRPLTTATREEYGIAKEVSGVLIAEVADDGKAAEKGIRPGDVIVEVGQEPVTTPSEVEERVRKAREGGRKSVLFLIQTKDDLRFVPLSIQEE